MEIEKCRHLIKCDFMGCNNFADYSFSTGKKIKRELSFCQNCLDEFYKTISKIKVPKGTKSPFKLNERLRRKNEK